MTFYVRARGDASGVGASVRQVAQRVDPNLPIFDMKTMTAVMDESLFIERMVAALSVAFGGLATLLAAIGLYGVMSYTVARRTREIGIRMALGAERNSVMWLVLKEVALMVAIGVGVGLPLAFALSRVVQSQLFDLSAHDPLALAAAAVILAIGRARRRLPAGAPGDARRSDAGAAVRVTRIPSRASRNARRGYSSESTRCSAVCTVGFPHQAVACATIPSMRIAILGSGGVGGYFGGRLAATGADVTFLARGAHLEALKHARLAHREPEGQRAPAAGAGDGRSV